MYPHLQRARLGGLASVFRARARAPCPPVLPHLQFVIASNSRTCFVRRQPSPSTRLTVRVRLRARWLVDLAAWIPNSDGLFSARPRLQPVPSCAILQRKVFLYMYNIRT
jgi:hypothetical protein